MHSLLKLTPFKMAIEYYPENNKLRLSERKVLVVRTNRHLLKFTPDNHKSNNKQSSEFYPVWMMTVINTKEFT